MKYRNRKYKYYKNKFNANRNNSKRNTLSDIEKISLKLLYEQLVITIANIYAYILLYISTQEGIDLILNKDNYESRDTYNPDVLSLEGVYIRFATQILFTNISIVRYNLLYKLKQEGKFKYSLAPNIYIIISNLISIISMIYLIKGAEGIVERDILQTIFGV